jgi:predicted RNase H-like HicB family nuclease
MAVHGIYHVRLLEEEGGYVLTTDEDTSLVTQADTLDEAVLMMRDLLDCHDLPQAELRLIIPPKLTIHTQVTTEPPEQLPAPAAA